MLIYMIQMLLAQITLLGIGAIGINHITRRWMLALIQIRGRKFSLRLVIHKLRDFGISSKALYQILRSFCIFLSKEDPPYFKKR